MKRIFGTGLLIALVALTVVALQQTNSPASASPNQFENSARVH